MSSTQERPDMQERTDEDLTYDIVKCLRVIDPTWVRLWEDDATLTLHVRSTLDELEVIARETGFAATGCIVVQYDHQDEHMTWRVEVGSRFFDE
jgi:hypothetical protein